jgi:uncharacterized protein (UPF0332 family)
VKRNENLEIKLAQMLRKARRSLDAAKRLYKAGDYDFSASRSYYAAFYAMEAALLSQGMTYSKHTGVIGAFRKYFLKSGLMPAKLSEAIGRLFEDRSKSDYLFIETISAARAKKDLQLAGQVVCAIQQFLGISAPSE